MQGKTGCNLCMQQKKLQHVYLKEPFFNLLPKQAIRVQPKWLEAWGEL